MLLKIFFVKFLLNFNFHFAYSCLAVRSPGGGDIPVTTTVAPTLPCATCSQLTVTTGSGIGVDEPITQTSTTGADGCRTVTVTCTAATAGTEVNLFYSNDGTDLGSSTATSTITRNLVCNANGQLVLTENGASAVVDEVQCISAGAAPACATCPTNLPVVTGGGGLADQPIIQTGGTDANGCDTLTLSCTTPNAGDDILYFWTFEGQDRGTSDGVTTVVRTLTCNANGDYILTEGGAMGEVDSVRCATA